MTSRVMIGRDSATFGATGSGRITGIKQYFFKVRIKTFPLESFPIFVDFVA